MSSVGNWDREMYAADEKAWDMIAAHHVRSLKGADYSWLASRRWDISEGRGSGFCGRNGKKGCAARGARHCDAGAGGTAGEKGRRRGLVERQTPTDEYEKYLIRSGIAGLAQRLHVGQQPEVHSESIALFESAGARRRCA